ncbi:type II toxin-antitoxin system RelE family toxin [Streptomyces xiamenensis]
MSRAHRGPLCTRWCVHADIKKLSGHEGLYRLRVGAYRVAYSVDNGELVILVVKVGHRREVYRGL